MKKKIRASELWAVIISIVVLLVFTIILPWIAEKKLEKILVSIDGAIENLDDNSIIYSKISKAERDLMECDDVLHLLYPHSSVTEIEHTMKSLIKMAEKVDDEKSQIISELCRLKGEVSMLMESGV